MSESDASEPTRSSAPEAHNPLVPERLRVPQQNHFGRFMFRAQWFTPFFALFMLTLGRALFFGQGGGWGSFVVWYIVAPLLIIGGTLLNVLSLAAPDVRRTLTLPTPAARCQALLWPISIIWPMFLADDVFTVQPKRYASVAMQLFGIDEYASSIIFQAWGIAYATLALAAAALSLVLRQPTVVDHERRHNYRAG